MKTVLYARSSIKTQEHSIDMQKALALEKIKKKGFLFDDLYLDEAVSARKTDIHERPQLSRLIHDIENGLVTTVYVYKRDRLARNVVQSMEIFELFRSKQITVVFTADNEIPIQYSPAGEFFELIIAGFNQREANQIIQRIKETKYTMTKQGKHAQGPIAYGYVVKDKHYEKHPDQAPTIYKLYHAIIETKCKTLSDFVRDMNQHNWFPSEWKNNRIQSLIGNTIYKGIRKIEEFGKYVEIENEKLRIVDELTWTKAQERIKNLIQTRSRRTNRSPMILDDLLFCGKCDQAMYGREKADISARKYYTCKKHSYIQIAPDLLEEMILEECAKFVTVQFQTYFPELYQLTHGNLIKFYQSSISESQEALQLYKQKLYEDTSLWLQSPTANLQTELVHLINCIHREELLQQHYPVELKNLKNQFKLMERLQDSLDLVAEVNSYSESERATFIRDIVHRIELNSPTLCIKFRYPFKGKAVVENFATR
ncbi:putative integrase; bacteriophage 370.1 [Paenibacillus sp. J45TS6]|uniref:recombinase family protein n=1 Tax=Paenibacillus sp. J45TS6 TaxID=2807196 RepID=UPI001B0A6FD4|nr:recombinase family protein [Paenibacillus sp. J45TS6]GIP43203.1 putative integrase; bacteriophage 370.1 [Paenibacillus sp. J45TS6]